MMKENQISTWTLVKRLLHIAAPVKGILTQSTLASIFGNLAQMGLVGCGALLLLQGAGRIGWSVLPLAGLVLSAVVIVACRYIEGVVSHTGAYRLLAQMRVDLFEEIRPLAPACLVGEQKGDILNMAVSDIETVEFFFAHTIGPMFTVVILPVITLIMAFCFDPLFAAVLLPIYLVVSVAFPLIAVKAGEKIGMVYRKKLGEMKAFVLESVYGIRELQIFNYGPRRLERLKEINGEVNRSAHGLTIHRQAVSAVPSFFIYVARIGVVACASYLLTLGKDVGVAAVVLSCVAAASFSSTQSLTMVVSSLLETFAAARRLFTLEDTPPAVEEPAEPKEIGAIQSIRFDHVNFSYGEGLPQILKDVDLDIAAGEKIGIEGESGMGKSTILRLLFRFWDPSGGEIRVNGIPLPEVSIRDLYSHIAVLEQDTQLFNGTIAENIALGKPEASMEEIMTAARKAGLHDFIMTLPEGYETQMGQMSSRLSGGERQRVGIARTMIVDPDVVVMDEPTSSLDALHERELLHTLDQYFKDKILILISHRSSTLSGCDRIVRLQGGVLTQVEDRRKGA